MTSRFRVCIMREDATPIILRPGAKGERDLVEAIVDAVMEKNVGFFKTQAHVKKVVKDAIEEVLLELKSEVEPI